MDIKKPLEGIEPPTCSFPAFGNNKERCFVLCAHGTKFHWEAGPKLLTDFARVPSIRNTRKISRVTDPKPAGFCINQKLQESRSTTELQRQTNK